MQKYDWKVITVSTAGTDPAKNAEQHLNQLQEAHYEVFATHTLPGAGPVWLVIIARKPKIDEKYDKRY